MSNPFNINNIAHAPLIVEKPLRDAKRRAEEIVSYVGRRCIAFAVASLLATPGTPSPLEEALDTPEVQTTLDYSLPKRSNYVAAKRARWGR